MRKHTDELKRAQKSGKEQKFAKERRRAQKSAKGTQKSAKERFPRKKVRTKRFETTRLGLGNAQKSVFGSLKNGSGGSGFWFLFGSLAFLAMAEACLLTVGAWLLTVQLKLGAFRCVQTLIQPV